MPEARGCAANPSAPDPMLQQPKSIVTDHDAVCSFDLEAAFIARGAWPVAGVDEAGRGPLAGPVAVAAVVLDPSDLPAGLNDSKALSPGEREALFEPIFAKALAVAIAFASAAQIDQVNIRAATLTAMARAVAGLSLKPRIALIDGRDVPAGLACEGRAVVRGDALSMSIAAASIVAKVHRDRLMAGYESQFPAYRFASNKGYGTMAHFEALHTQGLLSLHRRSFIPMRFMAARDQAALSTYRKMVRLLARDGAAAA